MTTTILCTLVAAIGVSLRLCVCVSLSLSLCLSVSVSLSLCLALYLCLSSLLSSLSSLLSVVSSFLPCPPCFCLRVPSPPLISRVQVEWTRKGYCQTRWLIDSHEIDLVNMHLFHDASNIVATQAVSIKKTAEKERNTCECVCLCDSATFCVCCSCPFLVWRLLFLFLLMAPSPRPPFSRTHAAAASVCGGRSRLCMQSTAAGQ